MTSAFAPPRQTMTPLHEAVLEQLEIRPGTHLLEVGCGSGDFLLLAAARGATVTGLDPTAALIEAARERIPHADLTVGEIRALPYPQSSFDVVTAFDALERAADPARVLREAGRVGLPGARIVIASRGGPRALERVSARAGLVTHSRHEVTCPRGDGGYPLRNVFTYLIATRMNDGRSPDRRGA